MAHIRTIQLYRGTTAQNDAFTGAIGELTMDTTTNELRLHDGTTAGGHKIVGNGTITITQGGTTKGTFTTNQGNNTTIDLDAGGGYHPGLFAHEWDDHLRNDVQWLRADTFSWQDGSVYEAAYNHLADDINEHEILYRWYDSHYDEECYTKTSTPTVGGNAYDANGQVIGTIEEYDSQYNTILVNAIEYARDSSGDIYSGFSTETVAGTTISFYLATDGHKICLASEESNVAAIYTATGAAWYYIIDTANQRFKLPRTSPQLRYVTERLNIDYTNPIQISNGGTSTVYGWFYISGHSYNGQETVALNGTTVYWGGNSGNERLSGDCILWVKPGDVITWSTWNGQVAMSKIYPAKYPEKAESGDKYLYFYVGSFTQTALENTAGITAETLNTKVDKGHQLIGFQEPTSANSYTWYRKYADGWVEQGGFATSSESGTTCNFPITMANNKYTAQVTVVDNGSSNYSTAVIGRAITYMRISTYNESRPCSWFVCGMAA